MTQAAILQLFDRNHKVQPIVGAGATYTIGSDMYPYTVVSVSKDGKTIEVVEAERELVGDFLSSNQQWRIKPIFKGHRQTFTLRKNGTWVEKGCPMYGYGTLTLGVRKSYRDPNF